MNSWLVQILSNISQRIVIVTAMVKYLNFVYIEDIRFNLIHQF